jgi:hypothetical protein
VLYVQAAQTELLQRLADALSSIAKNICLGIPHCRRHELHVLNILSVMDCHIYRVPHKKIEGSGISFLTRGRTIFTHQLASREIK